MKLAAALGAEVTVLSRTRGKTEGARNLGELSSSGTGGRRGMAQLLAFCAEHGITAGVEVLPSDAVDEALSRLDRGDVRYCFGLDLSDLG